MICVVLVMCIWVVVFSMFLNIIDFDFWFIWVFLVVVDVCGIIVVEVLFGVW